MLNYYEIGQRIRKVRKAHGLSQEELAEKIDISTTHMSHIETGNTKLSLAVLVCIATALGASLDSLVFGDREADYILAANDIAAVLDACDPKEAKLLCEIVKSAKRVIDSYS